MVADLNHPVTGLAGEDVRAIHTERLSTRTPGGTRAPCAQQLAASQAAEVSRNCEEARACDHLLGQNVMTLETINLKASLKIRAGT